jgi:bacterioferritin-associated ferredoxin
MIVCSCNVLSDHEIRNEVTTSREQPLSAPQVYDCLGCSIRCGRCARAVKRIITEASIACAERAAEGMSVLRNGGHLDRQEDWIRKYLEQDQPDDANNGQVIFRSAE